MSNTHYVFSGRMFAGKDYVAKRLGLRIVGFADPMYQMAEYCCGTKDKSVPGIRSFLQKAGQYGWGCVNEVYPHSVERAAWVENVRKNGREFTTDFKWVHWDEYGRRKDFWVNILVNRIKRGEFGESALGVTNGRFDHELDTLVAAGFQHYHVTCTPSTREKRMAEVGYLPKENEQNDASEQLAMRLDQEPPAGRTIMNDDLSTMSGVDVRRFEHHGMLTVNTLVERCKVRPAVALVEEYLGTLQAGSTICANDFLKFVGNKNISLETFTAAERIIADKIMEQCGVSAADSV